MSIDGSIIHWFGRVNHKTSARKSALLLSSHSLFFDCILSSLTAFSFLCFLHFGPRLKNRLKIDHFASFCEAAKILSFSFSRILGYGVSFITGLESIIFTSFRGLCHLVVVFSFCSNQNMVSLYIEVRRIFHLDGFGRVSI